MRLKPGWSLKRTLMMKYWQHVMWLSRTFGTTAINPDHKALAPGQKGLWVAPVPEELIVGVKPVGLPGYWMDREGSDVPMGTPPRQGEKVVLHLHGGAYAFLSANPQDPTAHIGRGLLERCEAIGRVFSIEYRLTLTPNYEPVHPFPTQLLDALTGYHYLVKTVGFSPEDIILEGDSAGGNLALALTRYLVDHENPEDIAFLPKPGRLLLMSPWCDLSPVRATPGSSWTEFAHIDYIEAVDIQKKAEIFCGALGLAEAEVNPYISPASTHPSISVSFKNFPRTFILCGGSEVFRDQIRVLRDRMIRDMGEENAAYCEPADGIHDFLGMDWLEPERTNSWNEIAKWLNQ
ncbi:alpha/beta-hydrolase [Heliocybe sulcata]|uniref:Alpha/beta-hydrolase n=1 Tax=Heliocybe sulcata TaxID=5364 RepID=A0A5C3N9D2_9AGAM|nr:alpha/beta-hydrolase [Heliocybe sulcata]